MTLQQITPLTTSQWEKCQEQARNQTVKKIRQPQLSDFLQQQSEYPRWMIAVITAAILLIAVSAFLLSAAKQVIAFQLINAPLLEKYGNTVSLTYGQIIIISGLALCEIGVITFGFAAKAFASDLTETRRFRFFQMLCMAIAMSGNISITALAHAEEVIVFDWQVAIAAPLVVIGVGFFIEHSAGNYIKTRRQAVNAHKEAIREYRIQVESPSEHPAYGQIFGNLIVEHLSRRNDNNKELIPKLVEQNETVKLDIAEQEWLRHDWQFDPKNISKKVVEPPKELPQLSPVAENPAIQIVGLSKRQQAAQLLQDNPQFLQMSGQQIADEVAAKYGVSINREYWNDAKRSLSAPSEPEFSSNGHQVAVSE